MKKYIKSLFLITTIYVLAACQAQNDEQPLAITQHPESTEVAAPTMMALLSTLNAVPTLDVEVLPTVISPEEYLSTSSPTPGTDILGEHWWDDTVFYEIFVRSFYDSDGDGVGDIQGLIEKLDYLNDGNPDTDEDLGITGIWLMPITESPSYHGYDVVDYYTVDQEYGTVEDFQNLIHEAHQRGIRVIVDLVLNHTSTQHTWFLESRDAASPFRDWCIWESETDRVA
jgi:hypothetical protein